MQDQPTTIKQLYPDLSDEQLKLAEENLTAYLALVLRVFTRLQQEKHGGDLFGVLTEEHPLPTMQAKVDSQKP
jgi:hypothetical protein